MSNQLLVLVADDEPSMLELVSRHLARMTNPKFEVMQASDGDEAWRMAREHLPDLVVLDVMMPHMSGWEVCKRIREDIALAHTGVVMLTGIGEKLNDMNSPIYGADQSLDKPFDFDDLDAKVRSALDARAKLREGITRAPVNGTSAGAKHAVHDDEDDAPPAKKAKKAKKAKQSAKAAPAAPAKGAPAKKAAKKAAPAKKKAAPAKKKAAPAKKKAAPAKKKAAPAKKAAKKAAPAKKSKKSKKK